jgi:hypothetical protein
MSIMERILYSEPQSGTNATVSDGIVYPFSSPGYIKAAYYEPTVAITADGSNYMTLTVAANSTTVASRATDVAGGSIVDATPVSLTMASGVRDKAEVEQGDVITCASTKTGTGPAFGGRLVVVVELSRHA